MPRPVFVLSIPIGAWHPVLPAAVASILAQREAVRVAILNASGDPRVDAALAPLKLLTAYRHDGPDGGQASAIQDGWSRVDGDAYGWLNADDFLYPDALSKVADLFEASEQTGVVTGQTSLFDEAMTYHGAHPAVEPPGPSLLRGNTISQPSTFVRKEALSRIGGLKTDLHYTMDWDLWARLYAAGVGFKSVDEVLSGVVIAQTTKTSQFDLRRARELYAISRRYGGHIRALKTLSGFLQYHIAERRRPSSGNRHVRTPPPSDETNAHLIASRPFTNPVNVSIARFDGKTAAMRLHGNGKVRLLADGVEDSILELPCSVPLNLPEGIALDGVIEPQDGRAVIDRIETDLASAAC